MEIVTQESYAPHQLVTLKQFINTESGDAQFQLYKVTELETVLHDARTRINSLTARLESQEKQIGLILDKMTADEWYSSNTSKEEVLSDLCDILDSNQSRRFVSPLPLRLRSTMIARLTKLKTLMQETSCKMS